MDDYVETGTISVGPGVRARRYQRGKLTVLISRDKLPNPGRISYDHERWHLSISHPERYPTWDEIGEARDALIPENVWLCMVHPPRAFWLNYNGHVLHLFELDDPPLIAQCKAEGRDAQVRGFGTPTREGE